MYAVDSLAHLYEATVKEHSVCVWVNVQLFETQMLVIGAEMLPEVNAPEVNAPENAGSTATLHNRPDHAAWTVAHRLAMA